MWLAGEPEQAYQIMADAMIEEHEEFEQFCRQEEPNDFDLLSLEEEGALDEPVQDFGLDQPHGYWQAHSYSLALIPNRWQCRFCDLETLSSSQLDRYMEYLRNEANDDSDDSDFLEWMVWCAEQDAQCL